MQSALDTRKYQRRLVSERVKPTASRRSVHQNDNCCQEASPGLPEDTPAGRARFEQWMERRLEETDPEAFKALRRGWCVASGGFRRELLLRMAGELREHHSGELHRAEAEAKVERIIGEELQWHCWAEADLLVRRKNDPVKLEMAARLRRPGCIKLRIGPRTVPVRSTYEQAGVLEKLENPGAVVTAANRDGSRSVELDAARLRRETTLSTKAMPCGYTWPVQRRQIGACPAICVLAE